MKREELPEVKDEPASILIVDDNAANIDVMLTFLELDGYDFSVATSGEMALKIARHSIPDLILMDVMMPGMDGLETCKELKADPVTAEIPVIFVTAKKEVEDIVSGFRAGGVDYISKPFRQEEVQSRVGTHLRLRKLILAQERLIRQLNDALAEVGTLRGLLPICSYCKKIKDEDGQWQRMEKYIRTRTEADFSHGICDECFGRLNLNLEIE